MKKTIFSFLVSFTFLSTLTFAQDSFTQQEIESLFIQDSKPLELIALSNEEMKTTEGAWLPLLALSTGYNRDLSFISASTRIFQHLDQTTPDKFQRW
ncbi:hypothetical protein [Helicobacter apodemus]|uniref:Uncharacterized protein n=1 Tax=Helicobacter apodemus TaxID=135569 RepID=A0A2U8FF61_9HELI|nr:hypothetical protein [Helicobacter apodemus]AWI34794.1 hypothetical protein CDV25_08480 [Helicobacter apodemus]